MTPLRIGCWLGSLLLLLVLEHTHAHAQTTDPAFEHFSTEDGLSHNTVFAGLQDRQGFLWFGTLDGLSRCDGYGCTVFAHDPRDTTSLSNSWVWSLYEDRDGVLWVGTWGGGLNRFDRATETFVRYRHDPSDPHSLSDNVIKSIAQDAQGALWVGTNERGVNRLDPETGRFTRYQHDPSDPQGLRSNNIHALVEDEAGRLWIGAHGGGLHRFEAPTETFTQYTRNRENLNDLKGLRDANVNALYEDRDGQFWVGTWVGGLHRMDRAAETFERVATEALGTALVRAIYKDRRGILWVGTFSDGLFRIDPVTGAVTHYLHEINNPRSLSDNSVTGLFEDHTGILWITTRGGVDRLNVQQPLPTHFVRIPGQANSLRDDHVMALMPGRDGGLWVGTKTGLDHLDLTTNTFTHYTYQPNEPRFGANPPVRSFWQGDAAVWVGTDGGGLGRLDRTTRSFHYIVRRSGAPLSLSNDGIFTLAQPAGATGELWIGTWIGINRLDLGTELVTRYLPEAAGLSDGSILALYEAPSQPGILWVGTNDGGLNQFDLRTEAVTVFQHQPGDTASLSSDHVLALYEDAAGTFWVGTGSGLNRMIDRHRGRFRVYTTDDGLPNNTVSCMVPDGQGRLWLGTNRGLARFDPEAEVFERFDAGDGFQEGVFERNACTRLADGRLAFGGEGGLTLFHPDSLRGNPHPPRVAITGFHLFNRAARIDASGRIVTEKPGARVVEAGKTVRLRYDENVFGFTFAGLHFANPSGNRYRYQLAGFLEEWVELEAQRSVSFTGLPSGSYVFRVEAASSDGVWSEQGASVQVQVLPPWWRTRWAYGLYMLLSVGFIIGFVQWRSRRLRQRNQELSRLVEERTAEVEAQKQQVETQKAQLEAQADKLLELDRAKSRFFANLSHEFRTPLTLIQSPIESALRGDYGPLDALLRDHLEITGRNTKRLRRLIDQLLDLTKLEAGQMRLKVEQHDVVAFLRRVLGSFASLSQRTMITLDLDAPPEPLDLYFDADKLEQVIVNLLSNAFKYTSAGGQITVRVATDPKDSVAISVEDTGRGIAQEALPHLFDRFYQVEEVASWSHEGTGIGLALVKELVELHGGDVSVTSRLGAGTTFSVTLPTGQAHLAEHGGRAEKEKGGEEEREKGEMEEREHIQDETTPPLPPDASASDPFRILGKPKILIVEDNADLRVYLRDHLRGTYRVIEAADGAEGFRQACEEDPDLIVSDVMMPEIDGLELLRRLKQHETLQAVPVILLTARAEERDRLAGFEAQADAYMAKPFNFFELKARIATLLATRSRLQRVYGHQVVHLAAADPALPSDDARFLAQVEAVVAARMAEGDFGVEALAEAVHVSRSQLYRRLEVLTGESPAALMRRLRLERAAQLLHGKVYGTVSEVASAVGFSNVSYFSRLYRQHAGESPSEALSAGTNVSTDDTNVP